MPDDQNHPAQTAGQPAPQAEPATYAVLHRDGTVFDVGSLEDMQGLACPANGETVEPLYRATQAGAVQPAAPADVLSLIAGMFRDTQGVDRNQPGFQHAEGWNAALRQLMDYINGGALGAPDHAGTAPKAAEPPGAVPKSPYFSGSEP